MRIVGGRWAGRALTSPGGRARPTAEAVRTAWLDLLDTRLPGARVLDLFAGTGALGLEALSRGARSVDFVENGPASLHALKANIAALRARDVTRIFKKDAVPFIDALEEGAYGVAFVDPPYGSAMADRVVEGWKRRPFAEVLGVEHASDHALPAGGRTVRFDETSITIYPATALAAAATQRTRAPSHEPRDPDPRGRRRRRR